MKFLAFSKKLLFTVLIGLLSMSAGAVDYHSSGLPNPPGDLPGGQTPDMTVGNNYTIQNGFDVVANGRRVNLDGTSRLTVDLGATITNDDATDQGVTIGAEAVNAGARTILNNGTIGKGDNNVAINLNDPAAATGATTITTTGLISGSISLADQDDIIEVIGGQINRNAAPSVITTGAGGDKIIRLNAGGGIQPRITGNVALADSNSAALNIGNAATTLYSSEGFFTGITSVTIANNSTFTLNAGHTLDGLTGDFNVGAGSTAVINADVTGGGTYTNNGTTTLNADLVAAVTNGDTFTVTGNRTITGAFTNNGTFTAPGGGIVGAVTTGDDSTFTTTNAFQITGDYTSNTNATRITALTVGRDSVEQLTVTGNVDVSASTIRVDNIRGVGEPFPRGRTTVTLINAGGNVGGVGATRLIAPDFAVLNFGPLAVDAADNVVLPVTRVPFETILAGQNITSGVGFVLTDLVGRVTGDMALVISELDRFTNQQIPQLREAIESLAPNTDSLPFNQARNMQGLSFGAIEENLTALAAADTDMDYRTGYVAGGCRHEHATWLKPFGNVMSQKRHKNNDGFTGSTYGVELGMDTQVQDDTRIGAALSVASSKLDTKTVPRNTTDAMSYQATLYGRYSPAEYFVDGFLALAYNQFNSKRRIKVRTINRVATGKFHGFQPSAKVRLGYNYRECDFLVTPLLSLQYTGLNQSKYTEIGAESVSLRNVNTKKLQALEGGVGVDVAYKASQEGSCRVIPTAHLLFTYDFKGDRQLTTANFTGGGASFTSQGSTQPRTALNLGAGLTMLSDDSWSISARYNFESKSGFQGNSLLLNIRSLW